MAGEKEGGVAGAELTCPFGPSSPDSPCRHKEAQSEVPEPRGRPLLPWPTPRKPLTFSPFSPGRPATPGSPC